MEPILSVRLTDAERRSLERLLRSFSRPDFDFDSFFVDARAVGSRLPARLKSSLEALGARSLRQTALVVTNGPVDNDLPPTPIGPAFSRLKSTFVSEGFIATCGEALGEIFAFAAERGGRLIQDVVPISSCSTVRSSAGSAVDLCLHTEVAFHPSRPEFVLLSCLRNPPGNGCVTSVASVDDAVSRLERGTRRCLGEPAFRIAAPASFSGRMCRSREIQVPVVTPASFGWDLCVNCNPGHTVAATPSGEVSLARLVASLGASARDVWLSPGDLLVIDNRRTAHGRPAFQPSSSGRDRWMQRAYVRQPAESDPVGRVVP